MRRAVIGLLLVVSCYAPKLGSPGYYCHPNDEPACPSGQRCLSGRCVDQESDMGVPGPDMAGPPRDMGGGNDMGGGGSCAATTMCPSAPGLGNLNADSGGTLSSMGYTSQWLAVSAVEANSAITGQRMRVRVTLTSPAAANFDLYVHRNSGGTTPECSTVAGSSTNATGADVVNLDWGETDGDLANGADDDALVSIEVRAAAGATCAPGQTWSLQVKGGP